MQQKSKNVLLISACCISSLLLFSVASADHDHGIDKHESKNLPTVTNETCRQECGACNNIRWQSQWLRYLVVNAAVGVVNTASMPSAFSFQSLSGITCTWEWRPAPWPGWRSISPPPAI
ncbi:MAG: hypothetical protein MUO63_19020 [Desulfobulbaceae bacterium]|nr:hypothetical protein [Desulfobulbaceae bacterium]